MGYISVFAATAVLMAQQSLVANAAKVYLCGDSTMAKGGQGIQGWGEHLGALLTIPVINGGIGGRSVRSFGNEGRFDAVAAKVQAGDTVVIEFGRNDGGSLSNDPRERVPCPGAGEEKCQGTLKGQSVTVFTFPKYMQMAGQQMTKKGAKVIFSSMTPHNIFWTRDGTSKVNLNPTPPKFVEYAQSAVKMTGEGASYVDHWNSTVAYMRTLGKATVDTWYNSSKDPVHTNPTGAKGVAQAFVNGVLAAHDPLAQYVKKA